MTILRSRVLAGLLCASFIACVGEPTDSDRDGDGLTNEEEVTLGTDPDDADSDDDGLSDFQENEVGLDPNDPDSDDDGLTDGHEVFETRTDPRRFDTDGDGVGDGDEIEAGTNPRGAVTGYDEDSDLLSDVEELTVWETDPNDPDSDDDGVDDYMEVYRDHTDPNDPDSDDDGATDGEEHAENSDPLHPDTDGDGLTDGEEIHTHSTDPTQPDSDSDGLDDHWEVTHAITHPMLADTDGDGLSDGHEIFIVGSDPTAADTDEDGLDDAGEAAQGSNPRRADTDGDGLGDLEESTLGTNPRFSDTDNDGLLDGDEHNATGPLAGRGETTDPLDPDSDDDGLDDGHEFRTMVSGEEVAHVDWADPNDDDTDDDGVLDGDEFYTHNSDPTVADTDGDALDDGAEVMAGTDLRHHDTDGDILDDADEVNGVTLDDGRVFTSDPTLEDTDGDGVVDGREVLHFETDPSNADTDGDGLTDRQEIYNDFDPNDATDGAATDDEDSDGLTNLDEVISGTYPHVPDSDYDGATDGEELAAATDPLHTDTDGDRASDGDELSAGADPLAVDSDGDGVHDGDEPGMLTDEDGDGLAGIMDPDSDGDTLGDHYELHVSHTDVLNADTDRDHIPDNVEIEWGLDPHDPHDARLDLDGDGVNNVKEYRYSADATTADADGDGIPDAVEIEHRMHADDPTDATEDWDSDGVMNIDEVCPGGDCSIATDPRMVDTDLDGLADMDDSHPHDPDRDDDGLLDGQEVHFHRTNPGRADSDGDGITDADDLAGTTSVRRADSDGDGLLDNEELTRGTSPDDPDTDGDGLSDFLELRRGITVNRASGPLTVFTLATNPDTDGDGLDDHFEVRIGSNPASEDTDGDGLHDLAESDVGSDLLNVDSDGDGLEDGIDPDPMRRDADGDGIPDTHELHDGVGGIRLGFFEGGSLASPREHTFDLNGFVGWARLVLLLDPVEEPALAWGLAGSIIGRVTDVETGDRADSSHAVFGRGRQVVVGPYVRVSGHQVTVNLRGGGDVHFRATQAFLAFEEDVGIGRPANTTPTFADEPDSDGDGLNDGLEAGPGVWTNSESGPIYHRGFVHDRNFNGSIEPEEASEAFWLEAEQHGTPEQEWWADATALNGAFVTEAADTVAFRTGGHPWGYTPGMTYSVFIRARIPTGTASLPAGCTAWGTCEIAPALVVDQGPDFGTTGCGREECVTLVPLTDQWNWHYAGTYTPGRVFDIALEELTHAGHALWDLDAVAILPVDYTPQLDISRTNSDLPATARRTDLPDDATVFFDVDLPLALTHPMAPDTDGDGWRTTLARCTDSPTCTIPNSTGWLTDGMELHVLGTNPMDADSDHDGNFLPFLTGGGTTYPGDAIIDFSDFRHNDANDPYPATSDTDNDGILDATEREAWLACTDESYSGPLACVDPFARPGDTCTLAPVADAVHCWWLDDDRDNDGLDDGHEDFDHDGVRDVGELDANLVDSDFDGIPDGVELGMELPRSTHHAATLHFAAFVGDAEPGTTTNPFQRDTDGDGIDDGDEDLDRDGAFEPLSCRGIAEVVLRDSCPDREVTHVATDATRTYSGSLQQWCETDASESDSDSDGLTDLEEISTYCTHPAQVDTDGDGLDDGREVRQTRTNPNSQDTDEDELHDGDEVHPVTGTATSDPFIQDTDGDEIPDGLEVNGGIAGVLLLDVTSPTLPDTDGDGLSDFDEQRGGIESTDEPVSSATDPDSDSDGLTDFQERFGEDINRNGTLDDGEDIDGDGVLDLGTTDPMLADSDDDFFLDGEEVHAGTDPNSASSTPSRLPDVSGLAIDTSATIEHETNDEGGRTGVTTITSTELPIHCPGHPSVVRLNGALEIDRSRGAAGTVVANGELQVSLPGEHWITVWTGRSTVTGIDPETGLSSGSTLLHAPLDYRPDQLEFGPSMGADFRSGFYVDACDGTLGGQAKFFLGFTAGFGLEGEGAISVRPRTLGLRAAGRFGWTTPVGNIGMDRSLLDYDATRLRAQGHVAALTVPGLGDLTNLVPPSGPSSGVSSSKCLACLDWIVDPLNGHLKFMPEVGFEMSIGPMTAESDTPTPPEFEIDTKRGFIHVAGEFEYQELGFEGDFSFDLAGQVPYTPAVIALPGNDCDPSGDDCAVGERCNCHFGRVCHEVDPNRPADAGRYQCVRPGCVSDYSPNVLPRRTAKIVDTGAAGDIYSLRIHGYEYSCPDGLPCEEADRTHTDDFDHTVSVNQQVSLLLDLEMTERLTTLINASTDTRCSGGCGNAWTECAQELCPIVCVTAPTSGACSGCVGSACAAAETDCNTACADPLPVEAYADGDTITIEADDMNVALTVDARHNGSDERLKFSTNVEQGINGHLHLGGTLSIPLEVPEIGLEFSGDWFADVLPNAVDNDPLFFASNAGLAIGLSLGVVGVKLNVARSSQWIDFGVDEAPRSVLYAVETGLRIDSVGGHIPGGLGNIGGGGQTMMLLFDFQEFEFCGEGELRKYGFTIPWAFDVTLPFQRFGTDFRYDSEHGGISGDFGLKLPLWLGEVEGHGEVDWNGDFDFFAAARLALIPGDLVGDEFELVGSVELDNHGVHAIGDVKLPLGDDGLHAEMDIAFDGTFSADLEGHLHVGGFELANVTGHLDNDGAEIEGHVRVPGLAELNVDGYVHGDDYLLEGDGEIDLPGTSLKLANASFKFTPDSAHLEAHLSVPGMTTFDISGDINAVPCPDDAAETCSHILLTGHGDMHLGPLEMGPVALRFEKRADGSIDIQGQGHVSVSGVNIADMQFEVDTRGVFTAQGHIDLGWFNADVDIEKTPGSNLQFTASAGFSVDLAVADISVQVALQFDGHDLRFHAECDIDFGATDVHLGVTIGTDGCMELDDVGRVCL